MADDDATAEQRMELEQDFAALRRDNPDATDEELRGTVQGKLTLFRWRRRHGMLER